MSRASSTVAASTTELRLSLSHAITVIGLFIGCLIAAFVIGYRSGKTYGYEDAARASLANLPRFRVPEGEQPAQVSKEFVSKVYSRLQKNIEGASEESTPPKLEKITEVRPVSKKPVSKKTAPSKKAAPVTKKLGDIAPKTVAKKEEPVQVASAEVKKEVVQEKSKESKKESETVGGLFELGNNSKQKAVPPTKVPAKVPPKQPVVVEAPVKAPVKVVAPVSQGKVPVGWYVQVAAPNNEGEAGQLVSRLKQNGFRDSRIQPAKVKDKLYYRVLVGPETTAVLAERLLEQLKREPYVKFKPYLKRVTQ